MIQETPLTHQEVDALRSQLNQALVGKSDVIELVIACLLAKGHLLFDDLPGLGKTTLAKALAQTIGGRFARVQCTPDLLPTDITGFSIFDQKSQTFEFREGPVFSELLLTDEINRATPRTQSALFEAMAERQVTIDNQTRPLATTFMVIATQNPVESHGAYPLPEAQLDRFAMKLGIGYPNSEDEIAMLGQFVGDEFEKRKFSRKHPTVELGLSPRGLITWQRVAQAWAFLQGRDFVIPEDVQTVAVPVLKLRISNENENSEDIIQEIIKSVSIPTE